MRTTSVTRAHQTSWHDTRSTTIGRPSSTRGTRALCDYARKLTLTPTAVGAADAEALRVHGFDNAAIHDAIQVIAYFNYINRIAEGVGTDAEPEWAPRP